MNNLETPISDEKKQTLANTFLTALKNHDWILMRTILKDDASWSLPGISLLSGEASGIDAVVNRASQLRDFGVNVQLQQMCYSMHGFALSPHNTASREELILDEYVAIVCNVNDEKIGRLTTYLSDVNGINNFFVKHIIK